MFYVDNLETRSILTYRDGQRIAYVNADAARQMAEFAQTFHNHPHAVIDVHIPANDHLARTVAPWLEKSNKV